MTTPWTAPPVARTEPPEVAGEREALRGWLDYHRQTLLHKCAGLTGEGLTARAVAPSSLSLLGLVRHMAEVERGWFRRGLRGEVIARLWDEPGRSHSDFEQVEEADVAACFSTWERECEISRRILAELDSLDRTFSTPRYPEISARCMVNHMIEEYSRHNGHADLLRERIDGATGDFPPASE